MIKVGHDVAHDPITPKNPHMKLSAIISPARINSPAPQPMNIP